MNADQSTAPAAPPEQGGGAAEELAYRLRQQQLTAEFGLFALKTHHVGTLLQEATRLCAQGLEVAATIAAHGARAASVDVQLGMALLHAGFDGARSNLEGKLSSFTDTAYVTSVAEEIVRLTGETTASTHAAESLLKALPA